MKLFGFARQSVGRDLILFSLSFITLYYVYLVKLPFFEAASLKTNDLYYAAQHYLKPAPLAPKEVVIVALEDESFQRMNRRWPWGREVFAVLVNLVRAQNPSVVALDFTFVGDSADKRQDQMMAEEFQKAGNVVIGSYFGKDGQYILPNPLFQTNVATYGFLNRPIDLDGVTRRSRLVVFSNKGDVIDYSFPLKIFCLSKKLDPKNLSYDKERHEVILRDKRGNIAYRFPTLKDGTYWLKFDYKTEQMTTFPIWKIFAQQIDLQFFKDKIVVVGITSIIFHDIFKTPIQTMSGVAVNTNDLLMYLNDQFVTLTPTWLNAIIVFLVTTLVCFITFKARPTVSLWACIGILSSVLFISIILFLVNYIWDLFGALFCGITGYAVITVLRYVNLFRESALLKQEAVTDGLTGLYIYRYFALKLNSEFERAKDSRSDLSLVIFDIDHFKLINDRYGHEQGNVALVMLAKILKDSTRKADSICRYGGEEFCVIMPNTSSAQGEIYSQNIRKKVEAFEIPIGTSTNMKLTISGGLATIAKGQGIQTPKDMIQQADKALYQAKSSGRNRICGGPSSTSAAATVKPTPSVT